MNSDASYQVHLRKDASCGADEPAFGGVTFTRREAIRLLAASVGIVALPDRFEDIRAAALPAGQATATASPFPPGAIVRTLLKDVAPEALTGRAILFHEHLSANWGRPQHFSDDVALMVAEVKAAGHEGIACIVDAGHREIGRSIAALRRIAAESGVPIVAGGGYYLQRRYPADIASKSVETLTEELVRDAVSERHGAFGEIGQSREMTADERKVFRAIGRAHVRTGLPILTHNPYMGLQPEAHTVSPDTALRQLDLLESEGVKPQHVALGHLCCLYDPTARIAQRIASRGAFVGFDRVTIEGIHPPDAEKVKAALALIEAGYAAQLLLSSDFAVEASLKKKGGAGLSQTLTVFAPRLLAAGVPEKTLQQMLIDNPRRFLAFVPRI